MIVYFAQGGLGNQLFQYNFIKTNLNSSETLFASGFDDISKYFENIAYYPIQLNHNKWQRLLLSILRKILEQLAKIQVIAYIRVPIDIVDGVAFESEKIIFQKGLINSVKYIEQGFFQSCDYFKQSKASFCIKEKYINEAQEILSSLPNGVFPVCIHVRRGDYTKFLVNGKTALLPTQYYGDAIDKISKEHKNAFFIFISDDVIFVKNHFSKLDKRIFVNDSSEGLDLAIMSLCKGAVLSASSFSWWGSYFMKSKNMVIAPKYWLGFSTKTEFQRNGTPEYAQLISVR